MLTWQESAASFRPWIRKRIFPGAYAPACVKPFRQSNLTISAYWMLKTFDLIMQRLWNAGWKHLSAPMIWWHAAWDRNLQGCGVYILLVQLQLFALEPSNYFNWCLPEGIATPCHRRESIYTPTAMKCDRKLNAVLRRIDSWRWPSGIILCLGTALVWVGYLGPR